MTFAHGCGGGLSNVNRSFSVNLPDNPSFDDCGPQLCARIRYWGKGQFISLLPMFCGGKWNARAICKKLLPMPTTLAFVSTAIYPSTEAFLSTVAFSSNMTLMSNKILLVVTIIIFGLLMPVILLFCIVRCFLARKLVRHSPLCASLSETSTPRNVNVEYRKETTTSYPYGSNFHQCSLGGYTERQLELNTLPITDQTYSLNIHHQMQNDNTTGSGDHQSKISLKCTHEMGQHQSFSKDNQSNDYVEKFRQC